MRTPQSQCPGERTDVSRQRLRLFLWMTRLRPLAALFLLTMPFLRGQLWSAENFSALPHLGLLPALLAYNSVGRWLVARWNRRRHRHLAARVTAVANAQIALDLAFLTLAVHWGGGLTSPGLMVYTPPMVAYGLVLPLRSALAQAGWATLLLCTLAIGEKHGWIAHHAAPFVVAGAHTDPSFLALRIIFAAIMCVLVVCLGNYLGSRLLHKEQKARRLVRERGALLRHLRQQGAAQAEEAEINAALLRLARALTANVEPARLLQRLTATAAEMLDCQWAVALALDETTGEFRVTAAHGVPRRALEALRLLTLAPSDSPQLAQLVHNPDAGPLTFGAGEADPVAGPHGWRVTAWIAIPLLRGRQLSGLLAAGYYRGDGGFTRRQLRLAEGIGHHGTLALEHARLFADLMHANRAKSDFVSTMSHELRSPLHVMIGYAEMLLDGAAGPLSPGQRDLSEKIDARARELLDLINLTLAASRLETGSDSPCWTTVTVENLVEHLREATAGIPRSPGVQLIWYVATPPALRIVTDVQKLTISTRNLVANALKFTQTGQVAVRLERGDGTLRLTVEDTGPGIPPDELETIFEMFQRGRAAAQSGQAGVGLGLYIVRRFVEQLGGTVSVESFPGGGARFRMDLPISLGHATECPPPSRPAGLASQI